MLSIRNFFGLASAAAMAMATPRMEFGLADFYGDHGLRSTRSGSSRKRLRTGCTYPHSSTRQRARYARQEAARLAKQGRG